MTHKDNPAFATGGESWNQLGLTTREYFAAMAMQGLLATVQISQYMPERIASDSVMMADALIKALNETK